MIFGLDWDGTYSDDVELWNFFVEKAQERGHLVIIATARPASDPIEQNPMGLEVVYCNGPRKARAFDEQNVPAPDVWIDDMPQIIFGELE